MDFFKIRESESKKEGKILKAAPYIGESSDFMTRGKSFYAVWDEENGLWTQNMFRLCNLIDGELLKRKEEIEATGGSASVLAYSDFSNGQWKSFINYISLTPDSYKLLDRKVHFQNEALRKEDYASKTLPYSLSDAPCPNYEELMSTIYDPVEREKLEWAIGSIFTGDSKKIQKFIVMYGEPGSGKSTVIKIINMLFAGYCESVDVQSLCTESNQFSMESFKHNPLVGYQDDTNLSQIKENSKLNSVVSHEVLPINEKHKSVYEMKMDTFIFAGSNSPVRITNAMSGVIRRLIDVSPSGRKLTPSRYDYIMSQIPFELGAIASHCMRVYKSMGKDYYNLYQPISMMLATDPFYSFVDFYYDEFKKEEITYLDLVWDRYKAYCEETGTFRAKRTSVRDQMKQYYREFYEYAEVPGKGRTRKVYVGFLADKFVLTSREGSEEKSKVGVAVEEEPMILDLKSTTSEIDELYQDFPAQYAGANETPVKKWENVTTTLKELDTTKLHYIFFPEEFKNHIVIDFDLKDEEGNKSAELNLREAAKWPATYAEFSKGGSGVHLHYIYDGDVSKLSALHSPGVEVKVFNGNSSLRRRLSYCNDLPVAHISSGLPLKEARKVVNFTRISSEKGLRTLIERNLRKEIHPATKPSIDFIYRILEDAYENDLAYDILDMRPTILAFAARSSHQADYCLRLVGKMHFTGKHEPEPETDDKDSAEPIVFYDVEVFKNFFLICWKYAGEGNEVVRMYNPTPNEVSNLFKMKLVGFNCKKYDNHILYARYLGYSNEELYKLSSSIINKENRNAFFREAYDLSYTDVLDFTAKKQGLKKWEIELGIHHQENAYPWDEPLDESHWDEVADYCCSDVLATEAVFNHCQGDFLAREILADLAGMNVNSSTNSLTEKIIFGGNRHPKLIYTHLDTGVQE